VKRRDALNKIRGKSGQNGLSAVGFLFSDRLLESLVGRGEVCACNGAGQSFRSQLIHRDVMYAGFAGAKTCYSQGCDVCVTHPASEKVNRRYWFAKQRFSIRMERPTEDSSLQTTRKATKRNLRGFFIVFV
jgi:hypothetical protein